MTRRRARIATEYWIVEQPPHGRPRWYCHGSEFETPDEAVIWALRRAPTAIVRTLDGRVYCVGELPPDWNDDGMFGALRAWPPPVAERREIDLAYQREVASVKAEERARDAYTRDRDAWLDDNAPHVAAQGDVHECLIVLPGDDGYIELEELDPGGAMFGGRRQGSEISELGSLDVVLAATSGRPSDDPWIQAVVAALAAERAWQGRGRRSGLLVKRGEGRMFHVSASVNRESIRQYGLDSRRMGATHGIAGSQEPELPGTFLCESRGTAQFFVDMARMSADVWAVDVSGLWLEGDPGASGGMDDGWMIVPAPIAPERLDLVERDLPSTRRDA